MTTATTAHAPAPPADPADAPLTLPPAEDAGLGRDLTEAEADYLFDVQGFRVLEGVLSPEQLDAINGWVDAQDRENLANGDWVGDVQVHAYGQNDGMNFQNVMEADAPVFQDLIDHPGWVDMVRRYITNDDHRLSIDECFLNIRSGGGFIPTHSGGDNVRFTGQFAWPNGKWAVGQINILMALTDIGPGDGGTTLIPGSHHGRFRHPVYDQSPGPEGAAGRTGPKTLGMREVNMKAGSALMFTDGICHGSMPRVNDGERRILVYRYSPHLLANRMNYIPSDAFLAKLTDAQKAIVQPIPPLGRPGRTLTFEAGEAVGG